MTEEYKTYAYFWISGDFATSDITASMGFPPTETKEKGDSKKYRPGKTWEESWWEFHSPLPRDEVFLDAHISVLLEVLTPKKDIIQKLQQSNETGITCVGYYTVANPGFHLTTEVIQQLAELRLSVDFDLYCLCDDEEEASEA